MRKWNPIAGMCLGLLVACALAVPATSTPDAAAAKSQDAPDAGPRQVTVSAEGYDRDDALKQALRQALEQGAGAQIAAYSEVRDFQLLRDTIYSRAAGVVSGYRVLSGPTPKPGGTWEITIEATVRPDAVAATWGEVQNVLDQVGRPRILVWIDETIDGQRQESSLVAARVEELFVKSGFDLVAREAAESLRRRAATAEAADRLAEAAKAVGAHILIRGHANADRAGLEDLYGTSATFYNCDVQARVYATDTGRLIASESIPTTRRGVRSQIEFSPQAARAALVAATFPDVDNGRRRPALATRLYESVLEQWSTQITAGREIELQVVKLDFRTFVALRKALEDVRGVRSVRGDFSDSTGRYRIQAQLDAATLAERLLEPPFDAWLTVHDLKPNRIEAAATAH